MGEKKRLGAQQSYRETLYFHEARLSGYTYPQIADLAASHFGKTYSPQAIGQRIRDYRKAVISEEVELVRAMEIDRLDRYLVTLDKTILQDDRYEEREILDSQGMPTGRLQIVDSRPAKIAAITTAVRIAERRAKILGSDAPERAELVVSETSTEDLEIRELARAAKKRRDKKMKKGKTDDE